MTNDTNEPIEYLYAELRIEWNGAEHEFYPSDARRFGETTARWDVNTWLETGETDHFVVDEVFKRPA